MSKGLEFKETSHMFVAETDSKINWIPGKITKFQELKISPAAAALNYGQAVFEGMKAIRSIKNNLVLFRPQKNACRFYNSATKLVMPPYPEDEFIEAIKKTVIANKKYVPDYNFGSLYVRPVMIGNGAVLGVGPSPSYLFYVFACQLPHDITKYPDEGKAIIFDFLHRTPKFGIGNVKAAANYAATLNPLKDATSKNFSLLLYLDSEQAEFIEELSSTNFFAVMKDNTLVTPELGSILPGITRDSILTIAKEVFSMKTQEIKLGIKKVLEEAKECFCTGTANGIKAITTIRYKDQDHQIGEGKIGDYTKKFSKYLFELQTEQKEDPFGWVDKIENFTS